MKTVMALGDKNRVYGLSSFTQILFNTMGNTKRKLTGAVLASDCETLAGHT